LFFPEVLTTAEDAFVVFSARIKGVSSEECNEVRYYYDRYSNTASLTRSKIEKSLDSIKTCIGMLEKVEGREDEKEYLISWMKEIAKTKAFYALPTAEYMDLYKEINKKYIARNIFKITNVEAYAALALIIRNSDAAMKLFRKLKSLKHRQD